MGGRMKLPPRSPGWMPLDYSLWNEIEGRVLARARKKIKSKDAYAKRLSNTAKRLPATLINEVLGRMKKNISAIVAAGGAHPKGLID